MAFPREYHLHLSATAAKADNSGVSVNLQQQLPSVPKPLRRRLRNPTPIQARLRPPIRPSADIRDLTFHFFACEVLAQSRVHQLEWEVVRENRADVDGAGVFAVERRDELGVFAA